MTNLAAERFYVSWIMIAKKIVFIYLTARLGLVWFRSKVPCFLNYQKLFFYWFYTVFLSTISKMIIREARCKKLYFYILTPVFAIFSPICPLGKASRFLNHQQLSFFVYTDFLLIISKMISRWGIRCKKINFLYI